MPQNLPSGAAARLGFASSGSFLRVGEALGEDLGEALGDAFGAVGFGIEPQDSLRQAAAQLLKNEKKKKQLGKLRLEIDAKTGNQGIYALSIQVTI